MIKLLALVSLAFVATSGIFAVAHANHGNALHNATERNNGNWYGSQATIVWTNPNLKNGQWVYHRTSTNHDNPGTCFRYSEIGWFKTQQGLTGLIVWDSGCSRHDLSFAITAAEHTYRQKYFPGGVDKYEWFVDGARLGDGQTNFSFGTSVTCGGEVATGVEAMGNTRCGANKKYKKKPDNTFRWTAWKGHVDHVDDAPYTNVNDAADPKNSFFSQGNE